MVADVKYYEGCCSEKDKHKGLSATAGSFESDRDYMYAQAKKCCLLPVNKACMTSGLRHS